MSIQFEKAEIPSTRERRATKYMELWKVLEECAGQSAVVVRNLSAIEVQNIRTAARDFHRRGTPWKLVTQRQGNDLVLWLVQRTPPVVGRTLQAIR